MDAYVQALAWLARRELSERQVRDRLARRGVEEEAIDAAVRRLIRERALDDRRVAAAYARSAAAIKDRGPERVRREIEALGVARDLAKAAVDEVFADVDQAALLDRAIEKRWKRVAGAGAGPGAGRGAAAPDRREIQRLYLALVRQGFAADRVREAIRRRRSAETAFDDESE